MRFGGHIAALIALEHLGLDLKADKITLLRTGVDPDRMAALEKFGERDAIRGSSVEELFAQDFYQELFKP